MCSKPTRGTLMSGRSASLCITCMHAPHYIVKAPSAESTSAARSPMKSRNSSKLGHDNEVFGQKIIHPSVVLLVALLHYSSGLFCFARRIWRVDEVSLEENLSGRMQRGAIFSSQILPLECGAIEAVVAAREFDSGSGCCKCS